MVMTAAGLSLGSASALGPASSAFGPASSAFGPAPAYADHPGRSGLGVFFDSVVAAPPAGLRPARADNAVAAPPAARELAPAAGITGDACGNSSVALDGLGCGPINCFFCVSPSTNTGNVSCHSPTDPSLWSFYRSESTANATQIVETGVAMAFDKNDVTANASTCGCTVSTVAIGALNESCSVRIGVCNALAADITAGLEVRVRAKAWVQKPGGADGSVAGLSAGWPNASAGYLPSAAHQAGVDAVHDLQTHLPTRCFPAELPPLVIVPGLTSSALEYKLTDAKPANGEFWCNRSTGGAWRSMWPLDNSLLAKPAKFACWASEMQVQFLPGQNTFAPARQGEETRLVDFGSFDGMPGLGDIADVFEQVGWETGKNLFGAPFDWRLPSTAQEEFFSSLKQLVERASVTNGGKKVALWAFSFGPQFTLSFLHRMEQAWKDQYIAAFVATSPVWAGAPAALISFATGYDIPGAGGGGPIPNLPQQCAKFSTAEALCYLGASQANQSTGTLADCCDRASASPAHLFNWFDKNTTCQLLNNYTGTYPCAEGALGYIQTAQRQRRGGGGPRGAPGRHGATALAPAPTLAASPGLDPGAILIKTLARASPSLMWAFPHAGINASHEWTADDVLLQTPAKNYTAFDYPELLSDLGVSATTMAQQTFLSAEPDLKLLAAPGVPTFVTYGYNLSTVATAVYNASFTGKPRQFTRPPAKLLNEDGDGLVPRRSCTRSEIWAEAQAAGGHPLYHRGYVNQPHAMCFAATTPGGNQRCYNDVLSFILTGRLLPSE